MKAFCCWNICFVIFNFTWVLQKRRGSWQILIRTNERQTLLETKLCLHDDNFNKLKSSNFNIYSMTGEEMWGKKFDEIMQLPAEHNKLQISIPMNSKGSLMHERLNSLNCWIALNDARMGLIRSKAQIILKCSRSWTLSIHFPFRLFSPHHSGLYLRPDHQLSERQTGGSKTATLAEGSRARG